MRVRVGSGERLSGGDPFSRRGPEEGASYMEPRRLMFLAALGAILFVPFGALAADDDARLRGMEERLRALEDKLDDSQATIEAQREILKLHAAPDVAQGSGMDAFFSSLEVGGFLSMSYAYNFNTPNEGIGSQALNQFNVRHNEFSFDAAKLEIGKPAAEPGSAGFQLDLLYGQNADILQSSDFVDAGNSSGTSTHGVFVQQAYISYNFEGIELWFGQFETLLGWEVIDSHENYNITHGVLFTYAIPLFHVGVLASGDLNEQIGWALGLTNGFNNSYDINDNKGLLGQLSFEDGGVFGSASVYWGEESPPNNGVNGSTLPPFNAVTPVPGVSATQQNLSRSSDDIFIVDVIGSFEASDDMTLWVNWDWGRLQNACFVVGPAGCATPGPHDRSRYWGVSGGAAMDLNDDLSAAVRFEWFEDKDNVRGADSGNGTSFAVANDDFKTWNVTGTLSYDLTENLSARIEGRYDGADARTRFAPPASGGGGRIFPGDESDTFSKREVLGIFQVNYVFD